jgi:predicted RNase H-like nuclease (RuvC/YqgF family)
MSLRDLRLALQSLSDQSLADSRRLDDTYYFILEKVSILRQTISSLQELSGLTKELHDNFESGAEELVDDIKGQVESSENFETQQKQIAALEERLKAGKEKADALTARLAEAKERVDARAKTEVQWAARGKRMSLPVSVLNQVADVACRTSTNILGHSRLLRRCHLDIGSLSPAQTDPR